MSYIQEIHVAPLGGPNMDEGGLPQATSRGKAGMALAGCWLLGEVRGWHDRRMAVHELSHTLHGAVHDGRAHRKIKLGPSAC